MPAQFPGSPKFFILKPFNEGRNPVSRIPDLWGVFGSKITKSVKCPVIAVIAFSSLSFFLKVTPSQERPLYV
jgi:hypothetical protein